jgi:hypothetical protein
VRGEILRKIRELAEANGGQPPGRGVFTKETGISEPTWRGVYWARWGDALVEAGYSPNALNAAMDEDVFFEKLAAAFRHYGRIPTEAEFRMYSRIDTYFPSHSTIGNRFSSKAELIDRMRIWVSEREGYDDVAPMLGQPRATAAGEKAAASAEGYVYLLGSGAHFKIGRSDQLERRVKEITIALPDTVKLIHSIRTDDAPGIEAYWHRRFADRRANGEWFKLTRADVAAFKRRKFQ